MKREGKKVVTGENFFAAIQTTKTNKSLSEKYLEHHISLQGLLYFDPAASHPLNFRKGSKQKINQLKVKAKKRFNSAS